jgi:uncharacterized protein (TIGR00725 family)
MVMLRKLPIIAVFGSGAPLSADRAALARSVGAVVARLGAHLLTGGGYGVMAAAAEGFVAVEDRAGLSIGVIPRRADGAFDQPARSDTGEDYPNPHIEIAVFTPLPARVPDWRTMPGRNHINVLTADLVVALPGNIGTRNEIEMTAAYRDEMHRPPDERPVVLVGPRDEFAADQRELFVHVETCAQAEQALRRLLLLRGLSSISEPHRDRRAG